MAALIQFSYTSAKKLRMASSVAALVGLAPTAVDEGRLLDAEAPAAPPPVPGPVGWWSSRNFTLAPVTKHEM